MKKIKIGFQPSCHFGVYNNITSEKKMNERWASNFVDLLNSELEILQREDTDTQVDGDIDVALESLKTKCQEPMIYQM